ncbi:MAG TPA: PAS domain-containing protein, partial [Ktedonobacterales bacterium]|nr:PAS domain-containing protein [Ktedonobacterales bacterium]
MADPNDPTVTTPTVMTLPAHAHSASHPNIHSAKSHDTLDADIIIANAPDPVFVSDLEGKILQANDAVSQLLGFRPDEVLEQSLSRFIS